MFNILLGFYTSKKFKKKTQGGYKLWEEVSALREVFVGLKYVPTSANLGSPH